MGCSCLTFREEPPPAGPGAEPSQQKDSSEVLNGGFPLWDGNFLPRVRCSKIQRFARPKNDCCLSRSVARRNSAGWSRDNV
jgi:hypothetical protein